MSSWPWHVLGDRIGLLVPTAMGNTHPKCVAPSGSWKKESSLSQHHLDLHSC